MITKENSIASALEIMLDNETLSEDELLEYHKAYSHKLYFEEFRTISISGHRRAGHTTAAIELANQAADRGSDVIFIVPMNIHKRQVKDIGLNTDKVFLISSTEDFRSICGDLIIVDQARQCKVDTMDLHERAKNLFSQFVLIG